MAVDYSRIHRLLKILTQIQGSKVDAKAARGWNAIRLIALSSIGT